MVKKNPNNVKMKSYLANQERTCSTKEQGIMIQQSRGFKTDNVK